VDVTIPLVEKVEQRFEFEDGDTIQMDYMTIFVAFVIVGGVAASGLLSEYISKHGGVSIQKVLVYSEMSIRDLSNRHGKLVNDPCAGDIPER
jgi:hypothetical protein